MMLATETETADNFQPARPWSQPYAAEAYPGEDAYSEYARWERWLAEHWDGRLPDADPSAFDQIDTFARIYLYTVMCDLADGRFAPAAAEAKEAR